MTGSKRTWGRSAASPVPMAPGEISGANTTQRALLRPYLAQHPGGDVVLVENERARPVGPDCVDALVRVLGRPETSASAPRPASGEQLPGIALARAGIAGLTAHLHRGAQVAVAERAVPDSASIPHPLHLLQAARTIRGVGADPDDGCGGADLLALARARGATHFLLPATSAWWLDRYPELADHLARRGTVVSTGAAGTLWAVPPAPAPGEPKIFGIGLNKTGTSSFHLALEELGLRSLHWGDRPAYHAVLRAQRDGERLLQYVGEHYDGYSDIGTLAVRFDLADLQYPGSKFVLTVRDVDAWLDSRLRHALRNDEHRREGTYQGTNFRVDTELWRAQWVAHIKRVTDWFAGRDDDLLVLDICGGEGWERFAPFLGFPVPATPFPRENVDRRSRDGARAGGHARKRPAPKVSKAGTSTNAGRAHMSQLKRSVKAGWRKIRRRLPPGVAKAISDPTKRVLRRAGVMKPPRPPRARRQPASS